MEKEVCEGISLPFMNKTPSKALMIKTKHRNNLLKNSSEENKKSCIM